MKAIENVPLFRTITNAAQASMPVAEQPSAEDNVKPPLPPELWASGLSQSEAWQRFCQLKPKYRCAFGCDRKDFTYYVAAPGAYIKDRPTHCTVKAIMTIR